MPECVPYLIIERASEAKAINFYGKCFMTAHGMNLTLLSVDIDDIYICRCVWYIDICIRICRSLKKKKEAPCFFQPDWTCIYSSCPIQPDLGRPHHVRVGPIYCIQSLGLRRSTNRFRNVGVARRRSIGGLLRSIRRYRPCGPCCPRSRSTIIED